MASIRQEVWIDAPVERVFGLLSSPEQISTWWDEQTAVDTPKGLVLEHSPGPEHGVVRFLVLETRPHELVRWRCISTHPESVPASEWTGTEIAFCLGDRSSSQVATEKWALPIAVQTVLRLEHTGWKEEAKYLPFCNFAWAAVMTSLSQKAVEKDG